MGTQDRDRVLLVSGDRHGTADLVRMVEAQGCAATMASIDAVPEDAATHAYVLAILRVADGSAGGLGDLRRLRRRVPALPVAVVGPPGCVSSAVSAIRAGALDYLEDPVSVRAFSALIRQVRQEPHAGQAALLDSLQTLTPGLVHEFRNPLSGILAGSQMLSRLVSGQGRASEYAEIIREEAQQLERFLGRLVEFGRLGANGLHVVSEVDLPALLSRLLDTLRPDCTSRRIRVVSCFDPRAARVGCDPTRLSQACAEILQNAEDAMPEGGTLTVTTRLTAGDAVPADEMDAAGPSGSHVEIECSDTGPGMSDEAGLRACEPFFSTRPRALGVGLSLAQAIARAHGGTLYLKGVGRPGARVVLQLPASADDGLPAASRPGQGMGSRT